MATNFKHLSNNKGLYDKMIFIEDRLCDGNSKEDYIQALSAMRGVLDIMMAEWVKKAGLSDANILMYMSQKFGNSQTTVNLYGRIYALEKSGAISSATAGLLHDIRRDGNDATHQGLEVNNLSKEQVYRRAVSVYEKLYRTTYEFSIYENKGNANSYAGSTSAFSDDYSVSYKRAQVSEKVRKKLDKPGAFVFLHLCFGGIVIFLWINYASLAMSFQDREIIYILMMVMIFAVWPIFIVLNIVNAVIAKKNGEAISKQLTEPELDSVLSMNKAELGAFATNVNMRVRKSRLYTPNMDWEYKQLLRRHMGGGINYGTSNWNQQQFTDQMNFNQQQQFTNQMNDDLSGLHQFMDQHQEFMNQQHQFMNQMNLDQQQQFMDQQQQFMDHATAFNDPLNSTEGPSIFNGGIDPGFNFGGGMDFGGGFGNGF